MQLERGIHAAETWSAKLSKFRHRAVGNEATAVQGSGFREAAHGRKGRKAWLCPARLADEAQI